MSGATLSTHVLDTARGAPAGGVAVVLERIDERGAASVVGSGSTDADGRLRNLVPDGKMLARATYRLRFDTGAYFRASGRETLYPEVSILFQVSANEHYHVPLLVSPFGYTTYRGS
jgi:5-hydroxyisourate hydrolase